MQQEIKELIVLTLPLGSFLFTMVWVMMLFIANRNNNKSIKDIFVFVSCALAFGIIGFITTTPTSEFETFCTKAGLVLTIINLAALILLIKRYNKNKKISQNKDIQTPQNKHSKTHMLKFCHVCFSLKQKKLILNILYLISHQYLKYPNTIMPTITSSYDIEKDATNRREAVNRSIN